MYNLFLCFKGCGSGIEDVIGDSGWDSTTTPSQYTQRGNNTHTLTQSHNHCHCHSRKCWLVSQVYLVLCFSSTDWDGTETLELWLGWADWKDEVSPTICDDQVGSDITFRIVSFLCLRFKDIMTFSCNGHLPSFNQVVFKFLVFILLMAADSHRALCYVLISLD